MIYSPGNIREDYYRGILQGITLLEEHYRGLLERIVDNLFTWRY